MQFSSWFKALRFFPVFVCLNLLLSFILEPARGASRLMWEGYYKEKELDTIFIGSSLCQETFDPYIFDEELGTKSYNMGTPLQAMPQTLRALETALKDHEIETVIFGMSAASLKYEAAREAELTFEKSRARAKGGVAGVFDSLSYLFSKEVRDTEKSVNYLFPWLYNHSELKKEVIKENVCLKLLRTGYRILGKPIEETAQRGYQNQLTDSVDEQTKWDENSYRHYEADLLPDMKAQFEALIQLCKQYEVDLIVIQTPHPDFDVISCYSFYEENQNEIRTLCESYDVDYYDFSLVKPEIFKAELSYFNDYEHLTREGSQIFCRSLCDFLKRRKNGENLDGCFYSVEEFLIRNASMVEEWDAYYW